MPSPPLTTVVITYHNEGPLLARAVRSVDEQTGSDDIEIVVVDDASEIPPPAISSRRPLRVIRSDRPLHVSAARNLGIQHARGDLVAFLDADDAFVSNRIAPHVAFLRMHPHVRLVGGQMLVTHGESSILRNPPVVERFFPDYLDLGGVLPDDVRIHVCNVDLMFERELIVLFGTGAMTVRRDALAAVNGFDERLFFAEEWDLQARLARCGRVGFVPAPTYYYHVRRPGSITTTKNPGIYLCAASAYRAWRRSFADLPGDYRRMLRRREHAALLIAAQLWLEKRAEPVKAMDAVLRSLESRWSLWAVRSLVRASLHRYVPNLIGRVQPASAVR